MAAITICSDFVCKIKSVTVSTVSPSICYEVMGLDAMILVFWMLSFKPTCSLSSFTFIKRLSSLPSTSIKNKLRKESWEAKWRPLCPNHSILSYGTARGWLSFPSFATTQTGEPRRYQTNTTRHKATEAEAGHQPAVPSHTVSAVWWIQLANPDTTLPLSPNQPAHCTICFKIHSRFALLTFW